MMNSTAQGTLARLLSKENITIQHGNFQTAFFDVESRTLGLPIWQNKGKDVYDLLVGHEVGHALFTPPDFHKDMRGARQDYINLVEDVRIERMIQNQYPGLISCFARGYADLAAEDFFGIARTGTGNLNLPDRLNIKFKLRNLIDIYFSSEELKIKAQIEAAQTWDEVVQAALDLEKFVKEAAAKQQEPGQIPQPPQPQPRDSREESEGEQASQQEQSSDSSKDTAEASAEDDSDDSSSDAEKGDSMQNDSDEKGEESSQKPDPQDASGAKDKAEKTDQEGTSSSTDKPTDFADPNTSLGVSTQRHFDQKTEKLVDTSKDTLHTQFATAPTRAESLENVMPYADLHQRRMRSVYFSTAFNNPGCRDEFSQFLKANQKVIGMMVKEFDLRKSAHQYSRATTSKTGSLDLNRLHSYRTSDDVFLSVTKLANAKNHGMVMFVDYSGSMVRVLPSVLKHLINMALFCRRAGIPFKVYGFTNDASGRQKSVEYATIIKGSTDKVLVSNTILLDLVNSNLSKNEFNDAIYGMWLRTRDDSCRAGVENLGSTPLNETIIIAHDIVKDFRAQHNFDKVTAIFLTDGSGNPLRAGLAAGLSESRITQNNAFGYQLYAKMSFKIHGRIVTADHGSMTEKLMENLKLTTGCDTMGFFIPAGRRVLNSTIATAIRRMKNWNTLMPKYEQSYKDDGFLSLPGAYGYDSFFIVGSGNDLDIEDEELEVTPDMTRSKIARQFKNFSSAKKGNRIFVTKFSEAVA